MAKKIKSNWTTHIISLLVSLIFVPVALLGQVGGNIIGGYFAWFNDWIIWWDISNFIKVGTVAIIAGYVAGYFSAFVIFKIYKKIIVNTATILPAALIIFAVLGDLSFAIQNSLDLNTLGHFIRNGLTIFVYYKMLKDYKN